MPKSKNKIEPLSESKREQIHSYIELLKNQSHSIQCIPYEVRTDNQLHSIDGSSYEISVINKEFPESRYYLINGFSYMRKRLTVLMDTNGIKREYELISVQLGKDIIIEKGDPCFLVDCNNQLYEIIPIKNPSGDF